jgi:hypothetical protein
MPRLQTGATVMPSKSLAYNKRNGDSKQRRHVILASIAKRRPQSPSRAATYAAEHTAAWLQ